MGAIDDDSDERRKRMRGEERVREEKDLRAEEIDVIPDHSTNP